MSELLEQYLNPDYRYNFWQNPDLVRSREDALRNGINCVSLAHLALKDLYGYELPSTLGCAEMYQDTEHFKPVEDFQLQTGDLVWFGIEKPLTPPENIELVYNAAGDLVNWRDFPVKHVGVVFDVKEESRILHATHVTGTNVLWTLSDFAQHQRYRRLYKTSRLKETIS
jgi:hypothetical protein